MSRRWIFGLIGVGGVAILAFLAATWQPAIPPIDAPNPASFAADQVEHGKVLSTVGGCVDCHTTPGGAVGAGGVGVGRMFGAIPTPNITPDPETGIGRWSLAAFTRAMREGVSRDGKHLLLGFPLEHTTRLSDGDIRALYAYLMNLTPVKAPRKANSVPFPLDVRDLQAVWKAIYIEPGALKPDPKHDAQWNRGAYLAEAVAQCSDCHTARNALGAQQKGHPYGSTRLDDGWWSAPFDIPASPLVWTVPDLAGYLRTGMSDRHGAALADMQRVTKSLRGLSDEDLATLATYITSLALPVSPVLREAMEKLKTSSPSFEGNESLWPKIYAANCAECHDKPGSTPQAARAPIGSATSLWMEEPNNFVRIVLDGIQREDGVPGPIMPGFRNKLSDFQIGAIAGYLRKSRTALPPWSETDTIIGKIRTFTLPMVPKQP